MVRIQARWPGIPVVNRQVPYPPGGPGPAGVKVNPVCVLPGGSVPPGERFLAPSGVALGFGPGAGVPGSASAGVGDGQAPRRLRVRGGGGGQVAGQPRVDRARGRGAPRAGRRGRAGWPAGRSGGSGRRTRPGPARSRIRGPGTGRPGGPRRPRPGRCRGRRRGGSPGPGAGPGRPGRAARPSRPRSRPRWSCRAHQVIRWSAARTSAGGASRMARPALPESSAHRSTRAFLAPCSRRSFAFSGATRAAARLIRLRSRPGLSPAACPRTCCSASRASSGVQDRGLPGDDQHLGVPQPPGPEQRLRAGQLDFEVPGQAQHLIGGRPVLGQRPLDLGGRGVQVRLRHPGAALEHGRAGGRTAAEQLRHRRVLEEAGRRLGPVRGGDQPDDLIIGGLAQPAAVRSPSR